ncbi:MAG: rhodanese-like domain-containing protein [Armatimonadota bacterium]
MLVTPSPPEAPADSLAVGGCPVVCAVSALGRVACSRFPHAARAFGLVCLAALAAWIWNARLPLGIPWLPSPGNRVGIPRAFERRLPEINAARALQLYEAGDVLFVDSRDKKDYDKDHIPGAVSFPQREWAKAWPKMKGKLPKDRLLVLYCYGAHCGLSTRQGKALLEQGYSKLVILDYGWKAWTEAGGPTTKQPRGRAR